MLKKKVEAEIEDTSIERDFCNMLYLTYRISDGSGFAFETKVARDHKKQGHTKPADNLHYSPQKSWELAVHENYKDTSYTLDEVKAVVISLYAGHDSYTPNRLIYSFSSLITPYASARITILVAQLV